MDKFEHIAQFALDILLSRQNISTQITLTTGESWIAVDTSYGRDLGDRFDHVYTHNLPPHNDVVSMFYTNEISEIADAVTGEILFRKTPD